MIRTPRSTTTTAPMPITRALRLALYAWTAEVKRARDEYALHPISTPAICEACGRWSSAAYCRRKDCPE